MFDSIDLVDSIKQITNYQRSFGFENVICCIVLITSSVIQFDSSDLIQSTEQITNNCRVSDRQIIMPLLHCSAPIHSCWLNMVQLNQTNKLSQLSNGRIKCIFYIVLITSLFWFRFTRVICFNQSIRNSDWRMKFLCSLHSQMFSRMFWWKNGAKFVFK